MAAITLTLLITIEMHSQSPFCSLRDRCRGTMKSVFFFQNSSESDPFILGIQTEWQLQQMIRFSHHSLLACDSSFGNSKLKDVGKWMKALADRVRAVESAWRINGFIIDDPALELDPIRYEIPLLFQYCYLQYFCNLFGGFVGKYSATPFSSVCGVFGGHGLGMSPRNAIILQFSDVFKRLGKVVHNIWSRIDPIDALEEIFQDFVDQSAFMQYFKGCWVPKFGNLKAVSRLIFSVMFIIFLIFLTVLLLMLEMWLSIYPIQI